MILLAGLKTTHKVTHDRLIDVGGLRERILDPPSTFIAGRLAVATRRTTDEEARHSDVEPIALDRILVPLDAVARPIRD
jgi:hypothetical protein